MNDTERIQELENKLAQHEEKLRRLSGCAIPRPSRILAEKLSATLNKYLVDKSLSRVKQSRIQSSLTSGFNGIIKMRFGLERMEHLNPEQLNEAMVILDDYDLFLRTHLRNNESLTN